MGKKVIVILVIIILFIIVAVALGFVFGNKVPLKMKTPSVEISSLLPKSVLEVMTADINFVNDLTVGSSSNPDYKKLSQCKGTVVYSMETEKIEIFDAVKNGDEYVFVKLPKLDVSLYVDEKTRESLAEYQKGKFTGSAENGYHAYISSTKDGYEEEKKQLQNYDSLMMQAQETAKKQIEMLIQISSINSIPLYVFFEE